MAALFCLLAVTWCLAWDLTGRIRRYGLRQGILDVPNERSSHSVPTPRGGGLAFVAVLSAALALFLVQFPTLRNVWLALLTGALLVAAIGWWDDRRGLSGGVRFAVHTVSAVSSVALLGGMPVLDLGFARLWLGMGGAVLAVVGIVWAVNLYNFMDGIDGLAAGEAVVVGTMAGGLLALAGDWELAVASWTVAAAVGGFLAWNWPPARIFMGDVGSGFIGYVFAVLALAAEGRGSLPLLVWVILLGVFAVDATATLLRRILHREQIWLAHRTHAYQLAVQSGLSHRQVTVTAMGLDLVLGGVALLAWRWPAFMLPLLVLVTGMLLLLWRRYSPNETPTRRADESPRQAGADRSS